MNDADHAADLLLAALAEVERVAPGLSLGQLTMLLHVVRREGVRISDLARLGGWSESRVSRSVRAMTTAGEPGALPPAYGLVEILRGGDARVRHLVPTIMGAALAKSLMCSVDSGGLGLRDEAMSLEALRRGASSGGGDQQSECRSF
ncbi:MarR family protein [compost metagenome]